MTKVIINDWSGGLAEDVRELKTDTFAVAKNFDIKSFPNKIVPYVGNTTQGQNSNTYSSGAVVTTLSNGTQRLSFLGANDSSSYYPRFYGKTDASITSSVFGYTNGDPTTTGYKVAFGTLANYKNKLICMGYSSTDVKMYSYDGVTPTFATVGTMTSAVPTNIPVTNIPKPFLHPADDVLYCGAGNFIGRNSAGTFTYNNGGGISLVLPNDMWITSLTHYGSNLAIAMAPRNPGGRSKVFLWGRSTTTTEVAEVIDWGEGELRVLENIDGVLVGISITNSSFSIRPQLKMSVYQGGVSATPVKTLTGTEYSSTSLEVFKSKSGNELYFTAKFPIQGETINQLWVAGKNRNGNYYMTPDRYVNGTTAITSVNGFDFIGDYVYVGFDSGSFVRTYSGGGGDSAIYPESSITTLVNQAMTVEDRKKKKILNSIYLSTVVGGTFTIEYSVDGGSWTEICSNEIIGANTTKEITKEATGKPLTPGKEYQFRITIHSQAVSTGQPDISEFGYKYSLTESINK